eukprot:EG_transcript_18695
MEGRLRLLQDHSVGCADIISDFCVALRTTSAGLEQRLWAAEAERAALQRELDGVHHIYGQVMAEFTATTERDRVADQLRGKLADAEATSRLHIVSDAYGALTSLMVSASPAPLGGPARVDSATPSSSPENAEVANLQQQLRTLQAAVRGQEAYGAALRRAVEDKDRAYAQLAGRLDALREMYDGELDQLGHFVEHARRLDHRRRQLEDLETAARLTLWREEDETRAEWHAAWQTATTGLATRQAGALHDALAALRGELAAAAAG